MSEISNVGYQDLRDYIQNNWKNLELRDESDNRVLLLSPGSDSRINWTHSTGAQELELTALVKGSDSDITLPTTVSSLALYKDASGEPISVENLSTPFTIGNVNDEVTFKLKIQVPTLG